MSNTSVSSNSTFLPIMRPEKWAELQGDKVENVRQQLKDGRLPVAYVDSPYMSDGTPKVRRKLWVNLAKIQQIALST